MAQRIRFTNTTNNNYYPYKHGKGRSVFVGMRGDDKIRFKEAPPADAIITITVDMDVIYKTSDYVIDINSQLVFE